MKQPRNSPSNGLTLPTEWTAHGHALRALATHLVGGGHDADDLVQDTWLRTLEHGWQRVADPRAWLSTVARNLGRNRLAARAHRLERESASARHEAVDASDRSLERLELVEQLTAELRALPDAYRTALHLRYFESQTPEQIAARLDVPLETVRTRLRRGLNALRERLDRRNGGRRELWCVPLAKFAALPDAGRRSATTALRGARRSLAPAGSIALVAIVALYFAVGRGSDATNVAAHSPDGHSQPLQSGSTWASEREPADVEAPTLARTAADPVPATTAATRRAKRVPPSAASTILARVEASWGAPMEGVRVVARCEPDAEVVAVTDPSGVARLERLGQGDWTLEVDPASLPPGWLPPGEQQHSIQPTHDPEWGFGGRRLTLDGAALEAEVVLGVWRAASISGYVFAADGSPAARVHVRATCHDWGRGSPETLTGPDGAYTIDRVYPGNLRVVVLTDPSHPAQVQAPAQQVEVVEGSQNRVNFRSHAPTWSLRGRVVDEHGQGFAGLRVVVAPCECTDSEHPRGVVTGTLARSARVAADGSFEIPRLPPGLFHASVNPPRLEAGPGESPIQSVVPLDPVDAREQRGELVLSTVVVPRAKTFTLELRPQRPVAGRGQGWMQHCNIVWMERGPQGELVEQRSFLQENAQHHMRWTCYVPHPDVEVELFWHTADRQPRPFKRRITPKADVTEVLEFPVD